MNVKDIKRIISEDTSKLERLLSYFGFHSFSILNENMRCAVPDGDNATSVSIYINESLYGAVYTRGAYKGDVFGIIEHVTKRTFRDIINITNILFGFGTNVDYSNYIPAIAIIEDIMNDIPLVRKQKVLYHRNELYDKNILKKYIQIPHVSLYEEAITPQVAKLFNVCYDHKKNRMLFPHYDWIEHDKIVGIQGRIVDMTTEECKEFGIPKYWNYIKHYRKLENLYGWYLAKNQVQEKKQLIIFESEKSVLKQFSMSKDGLGNSVALGGHELSQSQIKFIINNTSIDTEIVFALDKDMFEKEKYLTYKAHLESLAKFRKVTYIKDTIPNNRLLQEKDSPVDRGIKVWNYLLSERIEYR